MKPHCLELWACPAFSPQPGQLSPCQIPAYCRSLCALLEDSQRSKGRNHRHRLPGHGEGRHCHHPGRNCGASGREDKHPCRMEAGDHWLLLRHRKLLCAGQQTGSQILAGLGDDGSAQTFKILAFAAQSRTAVGAGQDVAAAPGVSSAKSIQRTHGANQSMPAMRGILSLGLRDCWGRGSRWASFSRSMVLPR